ncbi:Mu transposase C-terminal domain-containing protein [Breoghania sp.]|uniref:Mu transposase C-terminal domain-containing protein n=1 Tax=Breoghania sp. TaxID=2065378 RepID=UPI002AA78A4C|nr:Mu transposase C-terminal domain-containing protein [Breoghania sp.]
MHSVNTRIRFAANTKVIVNDVPYMPIEEDDLGYVLRRIDMPEVVENFTHSEIKELHRSGNLIEKLDSFSAASAKIRLGPSNVRITDLKPETQRLVLFRKFICDEILRREETGKITRTDKNLAQALCDLYARYCAEERARQTADGRFGQKGVTVLCCPSPTTVRRWLVRYERGHFNALSLVPGYGRSGNQKSRLAPVVNRLMREAILGYSSRLKPSKKKIHDDLKILIAEENRLRSSAGRAPLTCPSQATVSRAISQLPQFKVSSGREGTDFALKKFRIVHKGLDVEWPLERVEFDGWMISLVSLYQKAGLWSRLTEAEQAEVEKGRYWASAAIDARTRCVLALVIAPSQSAISAIDTLRMAVSDKAQIAKAAGCQTPWDMCGRIEKVVADNGSEYVATEFKAAVLDLHSHYEIVPAGQPQLRGRIERFFRTVELGLMQHLSGRTFENVGSKGDYDAGANAVFSVEEFGQLFVRYVVDVYHNTPHSGLGGETPRNCWQRLTSQFGTQLPPDRHEMLHALGTSIERKITKSGIVLLDLHYQSPELQKLRRSSPASNWLVRMDPRDLGFVSVRIPNEGWLTVECGHVGLDGVSVFHWKKANELLRTRMAAEAKMSEEIVLQAIQDVKATATEAELRAGIAAPILDQTVLLKLEQEVARDFSRCSGDPTEVVDGEFDFETENTRSAPTSMTEDAAPEMEPNVEKVPDDEDDEWRWED